MRLSDVTRVAMSTFSALLAQDLHRYEDNPPAEPTAQQTAMCEIAKVVLNKLDDLDDGDDPGLVDGRPITNEGEHWLAIAETGNMGGEYVAHVLHHFHRGGYPGAPWVQYLLKAIDCADEQNRAMLSLATPEYVGLHNAVSYVEGGLARLQAVLAK